MPELGPICGNNSSDQDAVVCEFFSMQRLMEILPVENNNEGTLRFESILRWGTHILELLG